MIGDAVTDVVAGRAAGLRTCAVTWGVHSEDQICAPRSPTTIVTTVEELQAPAPR